MELRQLQHFVAVAEEQQFTRAARRVNIVQSALSSSIRTLEQELQARLFVRTTRRVQLTPAGRAFLGKAREALDAIEAARALVAEVEGLTAGSLAIGTVHSLPAFLDLPSLIARFHATRPGIEVRLRQGDAPGLLDQVRTGRLDLAFLPLIDPPGDLETRIVACEDLVAVVPAAHPLAGGDEVGLGELCRHPFVDFDLGWGTRALVDRAFLRAGLQRHTAFEVTDLGTRSRRGAGPGDHRRGAAGGSRRRRCGEAGDLLGAGGRPSRICRRSRDADQPCGTGLPFAAAGGVEAGVGSIRTRAAPPPGTGDRRRGNRRRAGCRSECGPRF
jgi:DNA-binding transcriptional LysR family regulator